MTTSEDCYAVWAPDGARWTEWAKPAAFLIPLFPETSEPPVPPAVAGLPETWAESAVIVDLPGAEAVQVGMALAERGYRPVPLFNATYGPNAVVDIEPLTRALATYAPMLRQLPIPADARPAFLLDSRRSDVVGADTPGWYDNRWIVLPQDLPSGTYLRSQGIAAVTLVRRGSEPAVDLSHVLARWRQSGLRLHVLDLDTGKLESDVTVRTPSLFRRAWYVAIALFGLRRSNVGGFGAMVPEQTASGRGGFYG